SQILVLSCIVFSCFLFFFYGSGDHRDLHSFPTRRSSDLYAHDELPRLMDNIDWVIVPSIWWENSPLVIQEAFAYGKPILCSDIRSEEHTSELQSRGHLVCRLLLEKKKKRRIPLSP